MSAAAKAAAAKQAAGGKAAAQRPGRLGAASAVAADDDGSEPQENEEEQVARAADSEEDAEEPRSLEEQLKAVKAQLAQSRKMADKSARALAKERKQRAEQAAAAAAAAESDPEEGSQRESSSEEDGDAVDQQGAAQAAVRAAASAAAALNRAADSAASASSSRHSDFGSLKLPTPVQFSGVASTFEKWTAQMKRVFFTHSTPPDKQLKFAVALLDGSAWDWFDAIPESKRPSTWEALVEGLRKQYMAITTKESARDKLHGLTQKNSSTVEYVDRFRRLVTQAETMGADDQLSQFLRGLNASTANQITVMGLTTVEAAIEAAVRIGGITERNASTRHQQLAAMTESDPEGDAPLTAKQQLAAMQQMVINAMQQQQQQGKLYRGDHGRRGRDDGEPRGEAQRPLPKVSGVSEAQIKARWAAYACFKCGKKGHKSYECELAKPKEGGN